MKSPSIKLCSILIVPLLTMHLAVKVDAQTDQLIAQLMSETGVSEQQAGGGIGALMQYVQQSLDPEQFAKINEAVPELTSLLQSAPALDEDSSTVTQLSALLGEGETADRAKRLAQLRNSLDKLNLSSEQLTEFIPKVLDYAKSKGGDSIAQLLQQVLATL